MTKLGKKIAHYNARQITLKIWERNIILGILGIALIYFSVHFIIYLVK